MDLSGLDFDSAWQAREDVQLSDVKVSFISKRDLIKAKEFGGRPQDLLDHEFYHVRTSEFILIRDTQQKNTCNNFKSSVYLKA